MQEFARRGFEGATVDAVAETAGFTKGAVYSNFGSKDDLFFALMDQQVRDRTQVATDMAVDLPADRELAVRLLSERLTSAIVEGREWQLLFIDYWARAMRDASTGARFAAHRRELRSSLTDAIRQLGDSAKLEFRLPPEWITFIVLALSNGLALEELADPGSVPTDLIGSALSKLVVTD